MSSIKKALVSRLKATAAYDSEKFTSDLDEAFEMSNKIDKLLSSPALLKYVEELDNYEPKANIPEKLKKLRQKLADFDEAYEELFSALDF